MPVGVASEAPEPIDKSVVDAFALIVQTPVPTHSTAAKSVDAVLSVPDIILIDERSSECEGSACFQYFWIN